MIDAGVFASHLQAMRSGFQANAMAFFAVGNTLRNFFTQMRLVLQFVTPF
jgi:hypothetical protein